MRRLFATVFAAFLLALLVPALPARADAICACYHGDTEDCSYDYDPDGVTFPDSETECALWCDEKYDDVTRVDWAQDSDSEAGLGVGEDCNSAAETAQTAAEVQATPSSNVRDPIVPQLGIDIPDLSFSEPAAENGYLSVNFIGEYVSAVYKYLIGIALTIAIVFVMIGGLQYVVGASTGEIGKAKERIKNAITGFVLLLAVYVILFTVNPSLTLFNSVSLKQIEQIRLSMSASGNEGHPSACGGITSIADLPEPYKTIVENAKANSTCPLTGDDPYDSPTGGPPNCGTHHWYDRGADGDWASIKNLDYGASWGSEFKAPFAGTVTYQKRTRADNMCGNTITLEGEAGVKIFICHAKDFVNASGSFVGQSATVAKGDVIGHVGGKCCDGETPPGDWAAAANGWCNVSGTACSDPFSSESCSCQPVAQAGNTSGPHVHITWDGAGNILSCLDD